MFKRYSNQAVLPILKNLFLRKIVDFNILVVTSWLEKNVLNNNVKNKEVLDVGAGASNYKQYFRGANYRTLDTDNADNNHDFQNTDDIADLKFDIILLIEVLEHVKDTDLFIKQLAISLKVDGEIWITLPFNARYHPCPHDYYRWTEEGIKEMLRRNQLQILGLEKRGNTLTTCAQKLLWFVYSHRHIDRFTPFCLVLCLIVLPILYLFGHLSLWLNYQDEDPQGFLMRVRKSGAPPAIILMAFFILRL